MGEYCGCGTNITREEMRELVCRSIKTGDEERIKNIEKELKRECVLLVDGDRKIFIQKEKY